MSSWSRCRRRWMLALTVWLTTGIAHAQTPAQPANAQKPRLELYGHVMLDTGFQFKQNDPNHFDVLRTSVLPASENEFGQDGRFFSSVRQSRLGVRTFTPTALGELRTTFEFDLFGMGVDAGQTTFHLRHAYGELGAFGAGQYWSPFMDVDAFPNTLEYWGPSGAVDYRNVQVRWMPIRGDTLLTFALERPGGSGDEGRFEDRIEVKNVQARFPLPDFSGEYRVAGGWGYFEGAGILRRIQLDDSLDDAFDLNQSVFGWGVSLSSNLRPTTADIIKLQLTFGKAVQNHMNDPTADVGIALNPGGGPARPIKGAALPLVGWSAFLEHKWNDRWSSTAGYSLLDIGNTDGQSPSAFNRGPYALGNLLYTPAPNVMVGGELQYGRRENFTDGFSADDFRIQFSFKYNFSVSMSRP